MQYRLVRTLFGGHQVCRLSTCCC